MPYSLVTAPTIEPVSLEDAKTHLRVDHDDENGLIRAIIKTARDYCETVTRRQLITATWRLTLDAFPSGDVIEWKLPPLVSVTSLQYLDANGETQTFSSDNYDVDTYAEPGRIALAYNESWPTIRGAEIKSVTVTAVCGYGATEHSVPEAIRQAILLMIAHLFENREPVVTGTIATTLPLALESLLVSQKWGAYP